MVDEVEFISLDGALYDAVDYGLDVVLVDSIETAEMILKAYCKDVIKFSTKGVRFTYEKLCIFTQSRIRRRDSSNYFFTQLLPTSTTISHSSLCL